MLCAGSISIVVIVNSTIIVNFNYRNVLPSTCKFMPCPGSDLHPPCFNY